MTPLNDAAILAIFRECARACTLAEARALVRTFRLVSRQWAHVMLRVLDEPVQLAPVPSLVGPGLVRDAETAQERWIVPRGHAVFKWLYRNASCDAERLLVYAGREHVKVDNVLIERALAALAAKEARKNKPRTDLLHCTVRVETVNEFFACVAPLVSPELSACAGVTLVLDLSWITTARTRDRVYALLHEGITSSTYAKSGWRSTAR